MLTQSELDQFLRRLWSKQGFDIPEDDRMGPPIPDLVEESRQRMTKLEPSVVDTWIAILDEFQSWFLSLFATIYDSKHSSGSSEFHRSLVLTLSKIVGDTFAIRQLIKAGFDTSARTVLRSTSEYMEVLVALIDDPAFATAFVTSDTPEGAKAFWQNCLRGGKIQKRVRRAWTKLFGANDDCCRFFADWGRDDGLLMSGLAHPSFAGGMFTAIPLKTKHTDEAWLGIWGDRSEASANTVFTYAKFMFPVLLLGGDFPFGEGWPLPKTIIYDPDSEYHRHVKIGRNVLGSLVLSLGTENNAPHIFPDIDYSLFEPPASAVT